jgi:hypothetical protein
MTYASEVLADSPVAYWRLDDTSGTSCVDSAGSGLNGAYAGSPTLSATSLLTTGGGTAVAFDGTNDTITVGNNAALNATDAGFTFECWVKLTTPSADKLQIIADKTGTANANKQWGIWWDNRSGLGSPQRLRLQSGYDSTGAIPLDWAGSDVSTALAAGGYLVCTFSSTGRRIYWNGVLVAYDSGLGGAVTNTLSFYLANLNGNSFYLDGKMDEVALYGAVLSPARVRAHYNASNGGSVVITSVVTSDGQHNGFVAAAICSDSSILVAYRKASAHSGVNGTVVAKRSADSGSTWGTEFTIASVTGKDLRDPMFAVVGSDLWVSYFTYDNSLLLAINISIQKSTDNGATWDTARVITTAFSGANATSGQIVDMGSGVLLLPVYGKDGGTYLAKVLRSTDSGATWSVYSTIASNGAKDYTEVNILKLANGSLLAAIRCDTDWIIYTSTSTDGGATWSALVSAITVAGGRPAMLQDTAGIVYMVYRGTPTTTELTQTAQSVDNGSTWTIRTAFGFGGFYVYGEWIHAGLAWSEEATSSVASVYFRQIVMAFPLPHRPTLVASQAAQRASRW